MSNAPSPRLYAVEGAFVSDTQPYTCMPAGAGGLTAGPGGLAMGRFGWADLNTGITTNARTDPTQGLGFVLRQSPGWLGTFRDCLTRTIRIREGLNITLITRGNFYARFAGGASRGAPVFANLLDGSAIAGYSVGSELTPWAVVTSCSPGGLSIISTWESSNG